MLDGPAHSAKEGHEERQTGNPDSIIGHCDDDDEDEYACDAKECDGMRRADEGVGAR